jgi:DNA replicative helicase MCM subunit Mcm2 (Cdc46/Mcm family)
MARADDTELIDSFEEFYRSYYRNEIAQLAQKYPNEQKSLYVDWQDLYRYDSDLADDFRNKPNQLREYAEEALRLYDLPVDVSLGQAHIRVQNLPKRTGIREIRADHRGMLISVQGIVRKATDVRPKITTSAFECQRCGTLTRIPQEGGDFQEPHECQGCERQGPFRINYDQSEFIDAQKLRIQESPEGLRGGETPQSIDVHIEDDITGEVTPGDHVTATGILNLEQQGNDREKSAMFDVYMEGLSIEVEDEQFEEMDISEEDKKEIIELSNTPNIYEEMVGAIAPSIYGYEVEKKAMIFQLFSGVTKFLPDGSRTRGDLHILLVGDPGTGKSALLQYIKNIAPRSVYTSGKGSSAAGLCVTGETLVNTDEGIQEIRSVVEDKIPSQVENETAVESTVGLDTFDRESGSIERKNSSHVWRMPEKPCRRIETECGKQLEASQNTPLLTCGEDGLEWKEISEITEGDHVSVPKYDTQQTIQQPPVEIREFLELTDEKVKLTDQSLETVRTRLTDEFGTLRDAAAELALSEDFVYDTLSNRHIPLDKLDRVLSAIDLSRDALSFERTMLRHGDSIKIPDEFDADLMYLLGLVFGDGDIRINRRNGNRGCVRISNSNEQLLQRAIDIVADKFDKEISIEHQDEKVPCIRIHSATIARIFANAGMETPKDSLSLHPKLTTAAHTDSFLRGFMDADGAVSSRDNGGSSVLFSTISQKLARQIQLIFETYGVSARRRERDRRGEYKRADGHIIESKHVQHFVEIYGADIDRYADVIGFGIQEKQRQLEQIVGETRRQERIPVGDALATAGVAGEFHNNVVRGDNPGRERASQMLDTIELGGAESPVAEAVEADLRWETVTEAADTGEKEVFDLTVPETHNFVGNGIVTHNTAAAVRDDFGEGQQWTLEAGALVLADQGIAAVDELDKMRAEDQSAMHEALEQQSISVSKAGINATLKSRCSLLGAANPTYGRFDEYEPIGEQIDLAPPLISRFDLIFTVTDKPDEEKDTELAKHILQTNYAGELNTHRTETSASNYTEEEVERITDDVAPTIEPDLLRKYVAYAQRNCYPTMTEDAKSAIQEYYVDLRTTGDTEDAPVPVTARKLEALVRLAEASARVRLSDTVEESDAQRAIDIAQYCLEDIGLDPETGELDADMIETGTSKSQRDRIKDILQLISMIEEEYDEGAPMDIVIERAEEEGMKESKAEHEIEKLKQKGEVYEPQQNHLRTT